MSTESILILKQVEKIFSQDIRQVSPKIKYRSSNFVFSLAFFIFCNNDIFGTNSYQRFRPKQKLLSKNTSVLAFSLNSSSIC